MSGDYLDNPGTLKIDLMLRGVRIDDPEAETFVGGAADIDVVLPGKTPANIPCSGDFTRETPYSIRRRDGGFVITDGKGEVPVRLVEPPAFYGKKTTTGVELGEIASVHGSYTVITPSPRCDFFDRSMECRYCAGNYDVRGASGRVYTVDEVLETVEAVLDERAGGIIYLSVGFSESDDGGIVFLRPYVRAVKKHFNCLVAVEALPPRRNRWIDETYAAGADSVLYNVEIFDPGLFELLCPGRAGSIGRERFFDALGYAASIFPGGTVASHLIVGLEPPGSTLKGIDALTDMGVVPILPIYRPAKGRALRIDPLTTEIIVPVYKHLYATVKKKKINMNWVRDISMATTPTEIRGLVDGDGGGSIAESFYKSRLGKKTAWGLSSIRRKLRVKKGEDPPEEPDG